MESLYLLVPLSVILVFAAVVVFFAMSDGGQFDDMTGPSMRLLHDDDAPVAKKPEGEREQLNNTNKDTGI